MRRISIHRPVGIVSAACVTAIALVALPVSVDMTGIDLGAAPAYAKDNGGGKGGGKGGGNGRGNAHGQDKYGAASEALNRGNAYGHDKQAGKSKSGTEEVTGLEVEEEEEEMAKGAKLGSLNAAHASARAREVQLAKGNTNSQVGKIAAYEAAMQAALEAGTESEDYEDLIAEAAEHLDSAANKEIDEDVIEAVNDLLDVGSDGTEEGDESYDQAVQDLVAALDELGSEEEEEPSEEVSMNDSSTDEPEGEEVVQ